MSAVVLAKRLAMRRADGPLEALPQFTPADDPRRVRAHLLAFYRLRDVAVAERAALAARRAPLADRIVAAGVLAEIETAIERAKNCLRRIAKSGGRGVTP